MTEELKFQKKFIEWLADREEDRISVLAHFGLDPSMNMAACPSWEDVYQYSESVGLISKFVKETGIKPVIKKEENKCR